MKEVSGNNAFSPTTLPRGEFKTIELRNVFEGGVNELLFIFVWLENSRPQAFASSLINLGDYVEDPLND